MFFNDIIQVRFNSHELKSINKIIKKNKGKYDNRSHFIRCAVISFINNHK